MKSKIWIAGFLGLAAAAFLVIGRFVVGIDPFFHYHRPNTEGYFYTLDNQRSQNDGIIKNFEYDALITGTSMTENFKTSEMDALFGVHAVKVPFSGSTFREINDNLRTALEYNPELRIVVRGLDMAKFYDSADEMREDLGDYPTYLYDDNIFNDVKYIFNRDVVFSRVYPMTAANDREGFTPGITSFDTYSNWMYRFSFGIGAVCPNGVDGLSLGEPVMLSDTLRDTIYKNITQNVVSIAEEYPDVTFYYFFTPYSAAWWQSLAVNGTIYRMNEAERLIAELILEHDNIKLFTFSCRTDVTTDLNNYKDVRHYGEWVNSLMLRWMRDGRYQLTRENYLDYLADELAFYTTYDYAQMNAQPDYENDYDAAARYEAELAGAVPDIYFGENLESAW